MRQDIHNKRRRNGLLLAALVGAVPTASLAWWGPGPGPMWGTPGFSGPPGPPSVGQFMSNPWAYGAPSTPYGRNQYGPSYQRPAGEQAKAPPPRAPARAIVPWVVVPAPVAAVAAPLVASAAPAVPISAPVVTAPAPAVPVAAPVAAVPARAAPARTPAPASIAAVAPAASPPAPVVQPETGAGAGGTTISIEDTPQGQLLVDADGMSLYIYTLDQLGTSSCSGGCAESWPPALAAPDVTAGGNLSVITRADGSGQWAYKGRPLYRWIRDGRPGDTTGDGVGGVWKLARTE